MIYKKLAIIQQEIRSLAKDKAAFNYNYISGDKLLSEIRPRMVDLGLLLLPEVTDIKTDDKTYDNLNKKLNIYEKKTEVLCTITMKMTWVDIEDGEVLSQSWAATGMNGYDKGFGSALTYGERYYLLKLFHLSTDQDDVDAVSSARAGQQTASEAPKKGAKAPSRATTLDGAIKALKAAKNREELDAAWAAFPQFQAEERFIATANEVFAKIQ